VKPWKQTEQVLLVAHSVQLPIPHITQVPLEVAL
jgi:hypothetical protein